MHAWIFSAAYKIINVVVNFNGGIQLGLLTVSEITLGVSKFQLVQDVDF